MLMMLCAEGHATNTYTISSDTTKAVKIAQKAKKLIASNNPNRFLSVFLHY